MGISASTETTQPAAVAQMISKAKNACATRVNVAQYASGTLSNKQIKEMDQTPVVAVEAPGAGYALVVLSCYVQHVYGSTPFNSNTVAVTYGNRLVGTAAMAAFAEAPFDSTANSLQQLALTFQSTDGHGMALADMENKPLSFTSSSAFTDGTGTGQYHLIYKIIAVS